MGSWTAARVYGPGSKCVKSSAGWADDGGRTGLISPTWSPSSGGSQQQGIREHAEWFKVLATTQRSLERIGHAPGRRFGSLMWRRRSSALHVNEQNGGSPCRASRERSTTKRGGRHLVRADEQEGMCCFGTYRAHRRNATKKNRHRKPATAPQRRANDTCTGIASFDE